MLEGMCVLMLITGATARYLVRPGSLQGPGLMGPVKMQRSSAFGARKALVLFVLLAFVQPGQAVTCPTCKDTIGGCPGGADCPLLKDPAANAKTLATTTSTAIPDLSKLLPPELLCTFTRSVMETLSAVAKAPKGGGKVDISATALTQATQVVKAAINGFCTWEEAGMELATRLESASSDADITKLSAALTLLKSTSEKAGTTAQAAVQSGVGLYTFIWAPTWRLSRQAQCAFSQNPRARRRHRI